MRKREVSDGARPEVVPSGAAPSERVTDREHKLLAARWASQQRQEIVEQSEPTVNDLAEAYEMPPDEVYRQLQELRAEQEARRAKSRARVRSLVRAAPSFLAAMIVVGLVVFIGLRASRVPHSSAIGSIAPPAGPAAIPPLGETAVTSAAAHDDRGNQLSADKRYAEAEPEYVQAVQEQPGIAMYHNDLGVALTKQGKDAQALPQYRRAARIMPDRAMLRRQAEYALRTGQFPGDADYKGPA